MEKLIEKFCKSILFKCCEYFIFIVLAYSMFFRTYLTSDYGGLVNKDISKVYSHVDIIGLLSSGRVASGVMSIPLYIFSKMGITYLHNAWVMQLIGMFIYALCAVVVYRMFARILKIDDINLRRDFLLDACILLMFINPFITETYVYGCMHWAVGVLAACLGAYYWTDSKYVRGFLCGAFAVSFYQSDILIMLVLILSAYVLEGIEEKKLTSAFKKCTIVSIICVVECILNIAIQKLTIHLFSVTNANKNISAGVASNVESNFNGIFEYIDIFMKLTYGFAPYCYSLLLFLFCFCVGIFFIVKIMKLKVLDALIWLIYCGCMAFIPYSFGIVGGAGGFPPRVVFSIFFAIGGMILCVSRMLSNSSSKAIRYYFNNLFCITAIGIYILYTEMGITDCYIQQALDRHEVTAIQSEIENYEKETGITVKTILSRSDSSPLVTYPDQMLNYWGYIYNRRIMRDAWCQGPYINYVCGTSYKCGNMSEEKYEEYFGSEQWDSLVISQQLHFEGDTLYWAVY